MNGLTVRNSRFWDCEHFDILFNQTGTAPPTNITVENNFMDCCRSGYYSVYFGATGNPQWQNILIRNNSANKPMGLDTAGTVVGNFRFLGNIAPSSYNLSWEDRAFGRLQRLVQRLQVRLERSRRR